MPNPADSHAIEARDLIKTYRTGRKTDPVHALDGLSLTVRPGEVFGLIGPNGAGKSTTVRILCTLAVPDSGAATVAGYDTLTRADAVRRSIGLVPQRTTAAPLMTGRECIELAARLAGQSRDTARMRAAELLDRFDLDEAADRLTKTYSGGMARKLDVAIGIVNRPHVLFLDEPTTGLDPESRAQMWSQITSMTERDGMTVLLTTHYLDEADRLADRLAIIDHGRVVIEGSPDQLKRGLRGDGVVVELADATAAQGALARLDRLPHLSELTMKGAFLRARADAGPQAVIDVLASLDAADIDVAGVSVTRPSLDDVYLQHVGHDLEVVNS